MNDETICCECRQPKPGKASPIFREGPLYINEKLRFVAWNGREVKMQRRLMEMLILLARRYPNPVHVFAFEMTVFDNLDNPTNSIRTGLSNLRKAFRRAVPDDFHIEEIIKSRGHGLYQLDLRRYGKVPEPYRQAANDRDAMAA